MENGQSKPQNVTTVSAVVLSTISPETPVHWYIPGRSSCRSPDSSKLVHDKADSRISHRYHQDEQEAGPSLSAAQPRDEERKEFWSNNVCVNTGVSGFICRTDRIVIETIQLSYSDRQVIREGHNATVYRAKLYPSGQFVAIKKMKRECERLIDDSGGILFNSNELNHLRSLDHHVNVVQPKSYFFTVGEGDRMFMNLMMEYVPENLATVVTRYRETTPEKRMPMFWVKLYMYQLFRALGYIHSKCICHRNVSPQNILVNSESGVLKICDFVNAKILIEGERNSLKLPFRHYRAPEQLLQNEFYTTQIDVWSAGCVLAEVLLGYPIFPGSNSQDQLEKIVRVLGTPSIEQIQHMNPNLRVPYRLDEPLQMVDPGLWDAVFPEDVKSTPGLIHLVSHLLVYSPKSRIIAFEACVHPFFYELHQRRTGLPNGRSLPPLFNFNLFELLVPASNDNLLLDRLASLRIWATCPSLISSDNHKLIVISQVCREIDELLSDSQPSSNPVQGSFRDSLIKLRNFLGDMASHSPPDLYD